MSLPNCPLCVTKYLECGNTWNVEAPLKIAPIGVRKTNTINCLSGRSFQGSWALGQTTNLVDEKVSNSAGRGAIGIMKFVIVAKNFKPTDQLLKKLRKVLSKLNHSLRSFPNFEKQGAIVLEKRQRRQEYIAKVNFHLPRHHISTSDIGFSPEHALHKAAEDARDEVLKVKDLDKDIHEIFRRSKIR